MAAKRILTRVYHSVRRVETKRETERVRTGLFSSRIVAKWVPESNPYADLFVGINKTRGYTLQVPLAEWDDLVSRAKRGPAFFRRIQDSESDQEYFYYLYGDQFYLSQIMIPPEDIPVVLSKQRESKQASLKRELDKIKAQAESEGNPRLPIPLDVQVFVWNRDGGKCVRCGSTTQLEFDHLIPLSKGGSNSSRNLQLLCLICNRAKGSSIGG